MKIQVLVAAMNQTDHSLIEKMNINTDVIVGNQCDINSVEQFEYKGNKVTYLNFAERGVGLNRNNAIMRATGDILAFADEDVTYVKNYENIIADAFQSNPQADAIIFNTKVVGYSRGRRQNKTVKRVRWYNAMNYDTSRLAVKSVAVRRNNISFHTCFGGGAIYSCGEDSIFIMDMLKMGLKIYTYPVGILVANQTTSTWFNGYNEKFFFDKGALFAAISKRYGQIMCAAMLIKNRKHFFTDNKITCKQGLKLAKIGRQCFLNNISYTDWKLSGDKQE